MPEASSDRDAERIARLFEDSGHREFAERWRLSKSDAGVYLQKRATFAERAEPFLRRAFRIRSEVDSGGVWEQADEWRIGSPGVDRFEEVPGGYRAVAEYHGTFRAEFTTFPEAFEAQAVFARVQMDLFWALGWSTSTSRVESPSDDDDRGLAYLRRLSDEARADDAVGAARAEPWEETSDAGEAGPVTRRIAAAQRGSRKEAALAVAVTCRTLSLTTEAPTLERAAEFLGVYERLARDFARVLEWRWL